MVHAARARKGARPAQRPPGRGGRLRRWSGFSWPVLVLALLGAAPVQAGSRASLTPLLAADTPESQEAGADASNEATSAQAATPVTEAPATPTTLVPVPPRAGELDEPAAGGFLEPNFPGEPAEDRVIIEADEWFWEEGVMHAYGNVTLRTVQYTLRAQEVELDENQEWATLRGEAVLQGEYLETRGRAVRANLKTGEWYLEEGVQATLEAEFFEEGQVAESLYLRAAEASSPAEGGPISLTRGELTSCELANPHYRFSAKQVEIRPGKKVIARRPSLYLLGTKVMQLPFNLVLWLDRRNEYLPVVGQSDVEGWYAKFAYAYLMGQFADGLVRLNLTQKRGMGFGVEQHVQAPRQQGQGSIFYEPSPGAFTSRLRHRYEITDAWSSDLNASYQSHSGYFGNTTSLSSSLLLSRRTSGGDMQAGYRHSVSQSGFSSSRRSTTTFSQRQRWGSKGKWSLAGTMEEFSYGGSIIPRRELDTRFEIGRDAGSFDWALLASRRFDLQLPEGVQPRFALNRMPLLRLKTSTRRLDNLKILGRVPFEAELSLGQYDQQPEDIGVFRAGLDVKLGGNRQRWGERTEVRTSGRFLQAFYGDHSAQYILAGDLDLRRDLGGNWQTRLRYNHQERQGFAPIRIDYAGRRDNIHWQLVQVRTDRSRLDFSTGYDLVGSFWYDLRVRAEYMPSRRTKLSLQGGYDIERSRFRPLGLIWTQAGLPNFYITLATEYDPSGRGLTRAATEIDWRISDQWEVAIVGGYSGYTGRLNTLDVQLFRDLHCMVATLAYSKQQNEIIFNLSIKAFPSPERALGIGRGGQQFQPLPGQYY